MKYQKKPVIIDAEQLSTQNFDLICDFLGYTPEQLVNPMFDFDGHGNTRDTILGVYINTLEGKMLANIGDMIIKGVKGEFYPCKPDIFKETYEKVLTDYKDRLKAEYYQLNERLNKLRSFFQTSTFANLSDEKRKLMQSQECHMDAYLSILAERCKLEGLQL